MAMCSRERLLLAVVTEDSPTDEEWTAWLSLCRERLGQSMRVMIAVHGGGPDAYKRKALADLTRHEDDLRTAILTDSEVARGMVVAFNWLGLPRRGFGSNQYRLAAEFLELTADEWREVLEVMPTLHADTGTLAPRPSATGGH